MDGDAACLQCHKTMATNITAHTHHDADSEGSRCYNCHMPRTTFGLLHAMRSHQVSSPNVRESLDLRPAQRLQSLSSRSNARVDRGKTSRVVSSSRSQIVRRTIKTISAAVQWIVKGDAGQRALIAWGMGWEPAQKISGRDWLYPYLIYSLTRSLCRGPFRRLEIAANFARLQ